MSKIIGIMFRLKYIVPCDVLQTLYNSLIMPHFHYCLLAWGSTIKNGHKLHLLQKKAVKIITNSHYIAHTDPIFKKLHMVKVTDMFRIAIWKFYYKLRNNLLPPYFNYMKPNIRILNVNCYINIYETIMNLLLIEYIVIFSLISILFV